MTKRRVRHCLMICQITSTVQGKGQHQDMFERHADEQMLDIGLQGKDGWRHAGNSGSIGVGLISM